MKIKNNLVLFIVIILAFSALFVNFIIIKTFTIIDVSNITLMDTIYFQLSDLDPEEAKELNVILNSGNVKTFQKLLEKISNPVSQFYGFAGLLKSSKNLAIQYLKSGILESPKKVNIIHNGNKSQVTLGYSILLLLSENPDWLTNPFNDEFVRLTENIMNSLYESNFLFKQPEYKDLLLTLIRTQYPLLAKSIANEFVTNKSVFDMTLAEKRDTAQLLALISIDKQLKIITDLLKEKDSDILLNTLKFIDPKKHSELGSVLDSIIYTTSYSEDVKLVLLNKYAAIYKEKSLGKLVKFVLQNDNSSKIILETISVFEEYADDSHWAFLTRYLGDQYSIEINNKVLDAIIHISWESNPDNVFSTLLFSIRRLNYETAIKAIDFYITRNISLNQSVILTRLRVLENEDIMKAALRYIRQFKVSQAPDILIKCLESNNAEINKLAKDIVSELNIVL